jgi:hypothetical protein
MCKRAMIFRYINIFFLFNRNSETNTVTEKIAAIEETENTPVVASGEEEQAAGDAPVTEEPVESSDDAKPAEEPVENGKVEEEKTTEKAAEPETGMFKEFFVLN